MYYYIADSYFFSEWVYNQTKKLITKIHRFASHACARETSSSSRQPSCLINSVAKYYSVFPPDIRYESLHQKYPLAKL